MSTRQLKRNAEQFRKKEAERIKKEKRIKLLGIFMGSLAGSLIVLGILLTVWIITKNRIKIPDNAFVLNKEVEVSFAENKYEIQAGKGYYQINQLFDDHKQEVGKLAIIDIPTYNEYYDVWEKTGQQKFNNIKVYGNNEAEQTYILFDFIGDKAYYVEANSKELAEDLANTMTIKVFNPDTK